jgi:hypothetical protein
MYLCVCVSVSAAVSVYTHTHIHTHTLTHTGEVETSRCADGKRPVAYRSRKESKHRPPGARSHTANAQARTDDGAGGGGGGGSTGLSVEGQRMLIVECVDQWKAKRSLAKTRQLFLKSPLSSDFR